MPPTTGQYYPPPRDFFKGQFRRYFESDRTVGTCGQQVVRSAQEPQRLEPAWTCRSMRIPSTTGRGFPARQKEKSLQGVASGPLPSPDGAQEPQWLEPGLPRSVVARGTQGVWIWCFPAERPAGVAIPRRGIATEENAKDAPPGSLTAD